jgi:hypothetical protein
MVGTRTPPRHQTIDAKTEPPAKPLPSHLPPGAHEYLLAIDEAFRALIANAPDKKIAWCLHEAALTVAVRGKEGIPTDLGKRALVWGKKMSRARENLNAMFKTAHEVELSRHPKSRGTRTGKTAFEDVAQTQRISAVTAEKRTARYRKFRRKLRE